MKKIQKHRPHMERELNLNLSGSEVYYTACSLPVISINSCSELHRQKGFNRFIFLYKTCSEAVGLLKRRQKANHMAF